MKVVLAAVNSKFVHSNLALRYLKEYTKDLNYNCELMEFSINDRVERVVNEIIVKKPSIVAFSCYIWNMYYVDQMSKLIKLIDSSIKILYGGPEVSYHSREFLNNSSGEFVIEGEGEETYREFIEAVISNDRLDEIKGLYLKQRDGIAYGGKRSLMDMNKLSFPYAEEDDLKNKIVYYEASRGCPFNCKYCLSSTIRGVRFLDINRVKKELLFLSEKKVKLVKFVDRTFNCNSDFSMEIWEFLINMNTETSFHFEISADILKEEEIELLKMAPKGRFQFEVGVQTTNDDVLRNINRYVPFDKIKSNIIKLIKESNIKQHLDLIAGLPGEDFHSFKKSFNDVYDLGPDEVQLGFLKVLKGSPMEEEAEVWGIVHSPYTPYEVLKTNSVSYDELTLLKRVEEMVDKYYNSQKFNTIIRYFIGKFQTPFDFYLSLGNFYYEKGYFNRNISSTDYYRVFLEFNNEKLKESNESLKELIKFDYLMHNKKKWLPEFLRRKYDKDFERSIKDRIKSGDLKIPFENFHIEDFTIDVMEFTNSNEVISGNFCLIFSENEVNNIIDITNFLRKEKLLND
jgi:radical SAM superfamily enzyme YgiQ (UPF0313 family)